jgi:DNA-nicking Smr family endonuclease
MPGRKSLRHRPLRALASRDAHDRASRSERAERPPTFAEAVAGNGIAPLPRGARRVPAHRSAAPAAATPPPLEQSSFTVEEEDGWLSGYRRALGAGLLANLRGTPRATLDLHGERMESARRRLVLFLAKERTSVRALVLVIVGKGRHSPGGHAVLRHEIAAWLSTAPVSAHVLAFRTAPRELGGSGGVLVLLAPARSQSASK